MLRISLRNYNSLIRKTTSLKAMRRMATGSKVELSTDVGDWPEYYRKGITAEQTKKASEVLQENHEKYHIFFNSEGFHNHTAHHVLAIWALNATTESIQKSYESHKTYQRPQEPVDEAALKTLHDPAKFIEYLGPENHYHTFMQFFRDEIEKSSVQDVLQKYLFAGDERADAMFVQMFSGFLHPIIHLGYGIEFKQPAIVAEALAQAACHNKWIGQYLIAAEKAAKDQSQPSKSIVQLLDEIHDDKELSVAAHWSDGNKIRDRILPRAGEKMINYGAQFRVKPEQLHEKTAEMTNAVCLYTAAAQHPPNMVMYDFYFM